MAIGIKIKSQTSELVVIVVISKDVNIYNFSQEIYLMIAVKH
jgi:hypothetical protein